MSNSVNQQRETLSVTYVWMSVTFCVCLVVSNIFIPRLWQVGPLPVQLTGAVLLFPIGSLLAFIAGSTVNAWIMSKMKVATKGKGFGWRAIISTIGGEATDSLIFFPIAFGGMLPFGAVINLMFTQVVAKTLYEIIILPVTSWVVRKVKAHEGIDTYDENISYNPFKVNEI